MQFRIDPRIFQEFPDLELGVVVAKNISKTGKDSYKLFKNEQENIKKSFKLEDIQTMPLIVPWRAAYKKFGCNPKDYLSSIENLITRALKTEGIRSVNPLVDLYNYISIKYILPAGGENIDATKGDIQLTFAAENETPITLLGEKEARAPKKGEVIYKDDLGALVRRWNWKEAERTMLTDSTTNAIFFLEKLDPYKAENLEKAINELALLLQEYASADVYISILNKKNNIIDLDKTSDLKRPEKQNFDIDLDLGLTQVTEEIKEHESSPEHLIRIKKVQEMRAKGIEPWPQKRDVTATTTDVIKEFKEGNDKKYAVAGRVVSLRTHGKTAFADILDAAGRLQVYFKEDIIGTEKFEFLKHFIDLGDIVWVTGSTFKTKTGQITINVEDFVLESKSLHPLPEKYHGLHDVEVRYRQRYLDMISNSETRERFKKRSRIISEIRNFLESRNYIEVETPMLHPIPGGAAARPFITHHNALGDDFYLRIAPELYLKRLVIGGFERVFEINRNFRNEGVSTRHNPEFTMLEFYTAHKDYKYAMDIVEELLKDVAQKVCGSLQLPYGDKTIDFSHFDRLNAKQAIIKYGGLQEEDLSENNIDNTIKKLGIDIPNKNASYGEKLFAIFEEVAESKIVQPTFIIDFPIEISPLAKRDPENPEIASRFELFIAGMEISNAFTELNDPFDQAARFKEQVDAREAGNVEAHHYDQDYITALEYGLPPTAGVGIGIDRLVMLLTNTTSIRDVILFPTLKKK